MPVAPGPARRFLAGYENTSLPLEIYGQAFQSAYQAGQNSRAMTEYERKFSGFGEKINRCEVIFE